MKDYAQVRESRRVFSALFAAVVVLFCGVALSFAVPGVGQVVILIVVVVLVVGFAIPWGRRPAPGVLTPLGPEPREGSWPANLPAFEIPGLIEARPQVRARAEMLGRVIFDAAGIRWEPTAQAAGAFGLEPLELDPAWRAEARRLRGFRGQAQLTLTNPADGAQLTLWLRRASTFQIP